MRLVASAVAVLLLAAAIGACGGSDEEEIAAEQQRVTEVLTAYGAAVEGGRADEVCAELFAPSLVEELEAMGGCEEALGEAPAPDSFGLSVDEVTIDGTTATAQVTVTGAAMPGAEGEPEEAQGSVTLLKEGEEWRISEIG